MLVNLVAGSRQAHRWPLQRYVVLILSSRSGTLFLNLIELRRYMHPPHGKQKS